MRRIATALCVESFTGLHLQPSQASNVQGLGGLAARIRLSATPRQMALRERFAGIVAQVCCSQAQEPIQTS